MTERAEQDTVVYRAVHNRWHKAVDDLHDALFRQYTLEADLDRQRALVIELTEKEVELRDWLGVAPHEPPKKLET